MTRPRRTSCRISSSSVGQRVVVATLLLTGALFSGRQALAEGEVPNEPRLFLRLATGPAFNYESWSPSGPNAGASFTGWAPVLEVAVGRRVRPRLVIAGDLQLAAVVNRTESYLGGSYPLAGTLHFLDTLTAIADYTLWRHPRFHGGGGIGLLIVTDRARPPRRAGTEEQEGGADVRGVRPDVHGDLRAQQQQTQRVRS